MVPFESLGAVSYLPSIVTRALGPYVVSSARYSNLLVENREIFIPHLYLAPPQEVTCRNFVKMFDAGNTRTIGLPYGEKTMTAVFIQYRNVTDGQTDGQNCSISRVNVLTGDKN